MDSSFAVSCFAYREDASQLSDAPFAIGKIYNDGFVALFAANIADATSHDPAK
jgi:hypothetical protein